MTIGPPCDRELERSIILYAARYNGINSRLIYTNLRGDMRHKAKPLLDDMTARGLLEMRKESRGWWLWYPTAEGLAVAGVSG